MGKATGEQLVEVPPGAGLFAVQAAVIVPMDHHGAARDLAPPHQPAFLSPAPGADHDGQTIVLHVDAGRQHDAAPWHGQLDVVLGALAQLLDIGHRALVGVGEAFGVVAEAAQLGIVTLRHRMLRGQVLLDQARHLRARKRAVQLVDVEAGDAMECRRCLPYAQSHGTQFLGVTPQRPAVRATVAGRLRHGISEHFVRLRRVVGPAHLSPVQHLALAARRTRHPELALVARLVSGIDPAEAFHRGRATEDHLAPRVGLGPLFEQGDGVALVLHIGVAVVRFLYRHYGRRRRLHRAWAIGAH